VKPLVFPSIGKSHAVFSKVWKMEWGGVESAAMLRITGGNLGGRLLKSPPGETRPTQDKVRQAIFSALGEFTVGARVLDLFAGCGTLGLEAWSRGAAEVTLVESDRKTLDVLKENMRLLCAEAGAKVRCVGSDVFKYLEMAARAGAGLSAVVAATKAEAPAHKAEASAAAGGMFDLVLADPPYDRAGVQRWLEKTLPALEAGPILRPGGFLVFEMGAHERPVERAGWALIWDRTYGGTRVVMYRRGE
jgi:16S rRNA (guanine966-N2)-methyltransferase